MNYEKAQRLSNEVGETNDCTVKGIAIACDMPYRMVRDTLAKHGRKHRRGCYLPTQKAAIEELGFNMEAVEGISGTVSTLAQKLPRKGNYLAWVRGHVLAVKDGKIEDWTAGRRHRIVFVVKVTRKQRKPRHKHTNKGAA